MIEILQGILTISNLLWMNIGVAAGIVIGVLPGLGSNFAITVLLTLTFGMDSYAGIFLLLGAYCGATYGGSISAILINTPGTTNAVATTFDGYPLAQKGRAGDALNAALYASTIGGFISALALLFFAPQLAKVVLLIASPEYFCLCIFGLCAVVSIAGTNVIKGLISACFGLLLSCVGLDPIYGTSRMMFGSYKLLSGFKVVIILLGCYALSTVFLNFKSTYLSAKTGDNPIAFTKSKLRFTDTFKYWKTLLRSSIYGIAIGAIPGTGAALASMLCYNEARRRSDHPETFGQGEIEGVVAPECGNNAVTGATLIPLLTMGIPGDSCMAILLGALTMQGIAPGIALFSEGSVWVYVIMGGLLLINVFMLIQGKLFVRAFANCAKIPLAVMLPCIVVVCCVGAYSVGTSFDIAVMLVFGAVGYAMKRFDFPIPPVAIGLVLGTLCETNLRRSLAIYGNDLTVFLTRPVSLFILLLCVLFLFGGRIKRLWKGRRAAKGSEAQAKKK